MKANIKLELKTLTPTRVAGWMSNVHQCMDGNAHVPAPPVSMADLKVQRMSYEAAIAAATDGSLVDRKRRDEMTEACKNLLRQLADYVRMVAVGDPVILSQSGFPMARTPQRIHDVGVPQMGPARMSWRSGAVSLRWSGIRGRRGYYLYMTDVDPVSAVDVPWTLQAITGKVYHTVQDLVPFKPYWFCVSAMGPTGESRKSQFVLGRAA